MRWFVVLMLTLFVVGCQSGVVEEGNATSSTTTTLRPLTADERIVQEAKEQGDVGACVDLDDYAREVCEFEIIKRSLADVSSPEICDMFDKLKVKCEDTYYYQRGQCDQLQDKALKVRCDAKS